MKLNKNGWGFIEFFAFLAIFIICLLIAAYGLRQFGLLDDDWHFVEMDEWSNKEKEEDKDKPEVTYASLREDMVEATKKYILYYYNNELGIDTLNIKVSQLKKNGYLDKLEDYKGRECSGYVSVYLDSQNKIMYDPYLKCKEYETGGYESRKDG